MMSAIYFSIPVVQWLPYLKHNYDISGLPSDSSSQFYITKTKICWLWSPPLLRLLAPPNNLNSVWSEIKTPALQCWEAREGNEMLECQTWTMMVWRLGMNRNKINYLPTSSLPPLLNKHKEISYLHIWGAVYAIRILINNPLSIWSEVVLGLRNSHWDLRPATYLLPCPVIVAHTHNTQHHLLRTDQ